MKSILDPSFKYVPAAATDIRKTFARVRREQARVAGSAKVTNVRVINSNRRKSA